MQILLNGQHREVQAGATIAEVLDELQMASRHVAVEVNLELVPRAHHAQHQLAPNDRLEVVTLVGGG